MAAYIEKTNAMRALGRRRIPCEAITYDPAAHDAGEVAALLGLPPERVDKTLVVLRDQGLPLLAMASASTELDLNKLARELGEKRVVIAPRREAERLTGLRVGGIGTLALLGKRVDASIDAAARNLDRLFVNGGRRGLHLNLSTPDLVAVTAARYVDAASLLAPPPTSDRAS